MFEKICIKSKEFNNQKIDIAFLVETMLFYGKVDILVHKQELVVLLQYFGEDLLQELILTGRIELHIRENILGSMFFQEGKFSVNLFSKNKENFSSILYQAHRVSVNNSIRNFAFSDKFSKITTPFKYELDVVEQIKNDFNNEEFIKKTLPIYINSVVPEYSIPEVLEVQIVKDELKDKSYGNIDAYSLNSNLDLEELNNLYQKANLSVETNPSQKINLGGYFLSLAESKGDIYIASTFGSELVTSDLYSKFIEIQLNEIIKKRIRSQGNINMFDECILENCHNIGEAFVKGIISKKELLKILSDADKFRNWLSKVEEDKNIINEYYKAITKESKIDRLPGKTARFVIFQGIDIAIDTLTASPLGTIAMTGVSAFDSFYLDKIIKGWRPNQFIEKSLKPLVKK